MQNTDAERAKILTQTGEIRSMTSKPEARPIWRGMVDLVLRWPKAVLLATVVTTLALGALIYRADRRSGKYAPLG